MLDKLTTIIDTAEWIAGQLDHLVPAIKRKGRNRRCDQVRQELARRLNSIERHSLASSMQAERHLGAEQTIELLVGVQKELLSAALLMVRSGLRQPKSLSKAKLAEAAVLAYLTKHPDGMPTAGEIGGLVGIDEQSIRNSKAWKLHQRGRRRVAKSIGDAASLGDIDYALEEIVGTQDRGRRGRGMRGGE